MPRQQKDQDLRSAYGEYLRRSFHWSHFCTLTFSEPASLARIWREFHKWIRNIACLSDDEIPWFAAVEDAYDGHRHIHALVLAPTLKRRILEREWRCGHSLIRRYDPMKPGVHYTTKSLNRGDAEYDFYLPQAFESDQ